MTAACDAPLSDDELLDYWTHASPDGNTDRIDAHLFACPACSARLEAMAALGAGLSALVRRGRIAGIVSRSVLNKIQRDGVHVRLFTLSPGERIPCAAFPDDELLVVSLRADFAGANAVTLSVAGPDETVAEIADVPVGRGDVELLWASAGDAIRLMPTSRLRLTLRSVAPGAAVLGEYELDHTALP